MRGFNFQFKVRRKAPVIAIGFISGGFVVLLWFLEFRIEPVRGRL
jgi:hypothetical protein